MRTGMFTRLLEFFLLFPSSNARTLTYQIIRRFLYITYSGENTFGGFEEI